MHHTLAGVQRSAQGLAQSRFVSGETWRSATGSSMLCSWKRTGAAIGRWQELAVHAKVRVALARCPLRQVGVEALAGDDQRRQQADVPSAIVPQQARGDGLEALGLDGHVAVGTVLRAQFDEQQPQEMVQLGQRGDRALAPSATGALLDGNGRGDAEDGVDVGTRCGLHELARIGVQRLEVAPLPFGEEDVEGQRALAAARNPGDHRERIARDRRRPRLEVVFAGVVDADRTRQEARAQEASARPQPCGSEARGERGRDSAASYSRNAFPVCEALMARHLRRRAQTHQLAARLATLGTEVDDPVGCPDDVEIVLDHHQ